MLDGITVIVPMFNEADVVGDVVAELRRNFHKIVCVDDGSRDDSAAIARRAGATVVSHPVNLGQGAALQTGFDYVLSSSARAAITFDADGQYLATDAVAMAEVLLTSGVDVVLGSRVMGAAEGQPLSRRLLMRAAVRYSRLSTRLPLTDTHNGLRVMNRRALDTMRLSQRGMAHASEIEARIAAAGLTWMEHPVTMIYSDYSRGKGQSNLNAFNICFDLASAKLRAVH